ncbi:MAG TPA: P1 family peptidase [Vicinamibacterales bacterium]|nr:P1 family peptidase [Vicinamibacterales bacterium]
MTTRVLAAAVALFVNLPPGAWQVSATANRTLTAVAGVKVGHHTMAGRPTGCTVILFDPAAVASVDVRGGAPATRETDLLQPQNLVQRINAIVLSGGSAFGLDAASGVMRYLEEHGKGYSTATGPVPIVPAASLIDLWFGGDAKIRPNADCGYRAAQAAASGPVPEGNVGAGAGATVGKLFGTSRAMKAGIGSAALSLPNGLIVGAVVAVNAAGDVIDPATGRVVAGARTADGKALADSRARIRAGEVRLPPGERDHTTIGVVATNARLTKAEAQKVAQMAHDGYARAIAPVHTPYDGDTIFAAATGTWEGEPNLVIVGALAADAMAEAIVRAATQATGLGGVPASRDLRQ